MLPYMWYSYFWGTLFELWPTKSGYFTFVASFTVSPCVHLNLLVSPAKFSGVASTEDIYEAEAAYAASAATIEKLASQVSRIGITCQRYGAFLELYLLLES